MATTCDPDLPCCFLVQLAARELRLAAHRNSGGLLARHSTAWAQGTIQVNAKLQIWASACGLCCAFTEHFAWCYPCYKT